MQSSQMICLPCRRQLLAAAVHRARLPSSVRWQARASARPTSSATPTPTPQSDPHSDDDVLSLLDCPEVEEPWGTGHNRPNASDTSPTGGQRTPGRFSTVVPKERLFKKFKPRDKSLKLFEKVVREQDAQVEKADRRRRDLTPEAVEWYTNLASLRPMMKEKPIEECFEFFMTQLWSKKPYEGRNKLLKQRGAYLLGKVAEAKIQDFGNKRLPSVAQITHRFHEMEALGSEKWSMMMMGLIRAITGMSSRRKLHASNEAYTTAMARKEELLNDVVDSWIMFHRYRMSADDSKIQSSVEAEFRLPEINTEALKDFAWRHDYKGALGCIFPNWEEWKRHMTHIPAVAIATFVLLVDSAHSNVSLRQKAKPLLVPIGHVLSACPFRQPELVSMLQPYPTVLLYVLGQWDVLIRRLHGMKGDEDEHKQERAESIETATVTQPPDVLGPRLMGKITTAISLLDSTALENTWREWWGEDRHEWDRQRLKKHPEIFDYFILAFTALKKPNRAIDVWDAMTRSAELSPTLATWKSMLEGCRRSKNAPGIENVWRKLMAWAKEVGQTPDYTIWSTRIVGLMQSGEPEAGLRALNEMAQLSITANGVPVNIDVVNAAVASLLGLNATMAANKVLAWAAKQYDDDRKIEPNVVTYNTLLSPMARQGESAQIKSTLQMMAADNIKPDAATYTILLEGLINEDLDPKQQADNVTMLLSNMEKEGIMANQQVLGRMLHLVLRNGKHTQNHREGAAGVILEHSQNTKQHLSPHMYTILVQHYFARTPPAIAEVDALLTQRRKDSDPRFDRVLWESAIRGFATAGEADRAYEEFDRANMYGYALTLDTLEVLLRAMVKDGNTTAARAIVDSVKAHNGASVEGANNSLRVDAGEARWERYWEHAFWGLAMDEGLLSAAEWRRLRDKNGALKSVDGAS